MNMLHRTIRLPNESTPRAVAIQYWSRAATVSIAGALILTAGRVMWLKTNPSDALEASMTRKNGQSVHERTLAEPFPRGTIYDRRGQVVAMDTTGWFVYCDPKVVYREAQEALEKWERASESKKSALLEKGKEPPSLDPFGDIAARVAAAIGANPADVLTEITKRTDPELHVLKPSLTTEEWAKFPRYIVLGKGLNDAQVDALRSAKVAGAVLSPQPVRAYPYGGLAAPIIGKVGADHKGLSGYEFRAEDALSPTGGRVTYLCDNRGQVITIPEHGLQVGAEGEDVVLSIDMVIQEIAERELKATVEAANASGGRCIVLDVDTGEILAACDTIKSNTGRTAITEDPGAKIDPSLARMRWVTDPFEPGSIFKPFVWAWAVQGGFAKPNETIRLPDGPMTLTDGRAKRTIREAHRSSYGTKTWESVLVKSVNAGMATVALRMSTQEMKDMLTGFGFGLKTNIGIPGETAGQLPPRDEWSNRTRAQTSVAFGQGVSVSALQLVHAFSAFCRDGTMVPLRMLVGARANAPAIPVLNEPVVMATREAMEKVITEGTGKRLKPILHYRAFGKSGTAQLAAPKGGYYADRYMSSFIMGAPYEQPKIVILVTIEDPDKKKLGDGVGGGALAGPCAAKIMNGALEYIGVPHGAELPYEPKTKIAAATASR